MINSHCSYNLLSYRIMSLIIDQGCDHHIYVQTILDIYNIIVRENQFWISVRLSVVFFSNNFCFVSLTLQIYYDYAIAPLRLFNMIVLSIIQFVLGFFLRSIRWISYPRSTICIEPEAKWILHYDGIYFIK